MDRWQRERNAPAFTLMSGDICRDLAGDGFDMAIVGAVRPKSLPRYSSRLDPRATQSCLSASSPLT